MLGKTVTYKYFNGLQGGAGYDSKSVVRKDVPVRVRLGAPTYG
jgi:hypothetical protein